MIFQSLTADELERWVASSPQDLPAKVEMLRRAIRVVAGASDELLDLDIQLAQRDERIAELEHDLAEFTDV